MKTAVFPSGGYTGPVATPKKDKSPYERLFAGMRHYYDAVEKTGRQKNRTLTI